jgi:2,3-bisphosphoglycerate-independent phosphoglycerate mutase
MRKGRFHKSWRSKPSPTHAAHMNEAMCRTTGELREIPVNEERKQNHQPVDGV